MEQICLRLTRTTSIVRGAAIVAITSVLLSACGSDNPGSSALDPSVSDATNQTANALEKTGSRGHRNGRVTNKPPVIAGTPNPNVLVGEAWSFTPTASDPQGARLAFSITNQPSWTKFNATTGALAGVPTSGDTRVWANITVTASDGKLATSLPPFSLTVAANTPPAPPPAAAAPAPVTASATLSWVPPTANEDASPLTNLAGFRIHYGNAAAALDQIVNVASPAATQQIVGGLVSGTWYFAVTALTSSGAESALSAIASKTIP